MEMTKPFYEVRNILELRDLLLQSADIYGDLPAFKVRNGSEGYREISFIDYKNEINYLGTALRALGFTGGVKIAVAGQNCYEWCLAYMSVVIGANIIVPIDKELLFDDINNICNIADVKLVFCDARFAKKMLDGSRKLNPEMKIVCFDSDEDCNGTESFSSMLERGKAAFLSGDTAYTETELDPDKLSSLLFTSGTTGMSKGVMLCQRNFCSDVMHTMQVVKIDPKDRGLSILPMHHTYESTIMMFMALYSGVPLSFCDGMKYVVKNMKEYSPTIFVSVPLLLEKVHRKIIKAIESKKYGSLKFKVGKKVCKIGSLIGLDLKKIFFKEIQEIFGGSMRLVITGAAPINPRILEDFDAFGIQIIFGYGLTECSPLVICNNDRLHLAESIGVPLPGVEVKVINRDENGVGELCIKGPMVMLGYYNDPEETAKVLDSDGWFHTGDLGYCDAKGHYYLTGRCKNVIVTKNGKNICPEEVELYLDQSSIVEECMVYSGTDANGDTVVEAMIFPSYEEIENMLNTKEISESDIRALMDDVIEAVNKQLPTYKRIYSYKLRDTEFVKTTTAKIQRHKNIA